jgi:predicted glycogen debranching enzyme
MGTTAATTLTTTKTAGTVTATANDGPGTGGSGSARVIERQVIVERGSDLEWLLADGTGGFASGTVSGVRTRRYHALLLVATAPPAGRMVLVNGIEAWVETGEGRHAISAQSYGDGIVFPDGAGRIASFCCEPWPTWRFALPDGTELVQEIVVARGVPATLLTWRLAGARPGTQLVVRPLLSGRDYHALHHENPAFRFEAEVAPGRVVWRPYDAVPPTLALHDGVYEPSPLWYRSFLYARERERGLDDHEDLAAPGVLRFDLAAGDAHLAFAVAGSSEPGAAPQSLPGWLAQATRESIAVAAEHLRVSERARLAAFPSRLHRGADAYLVRGGRGSTVIAGYPWFVDWGRDTFIALRGLCLATGRLAEARDILASWAGAVSQGMLPNRFPDRGEQPEFNSVDASLWYVVAVAELVERARRADYALRADELRAMREAVHAILDGFATGTRYGIRCDADGLLAAGEPGVQLTWMDAKVGDWVVTPRVGKPVEVQALWLNALASAAEDDGRWGRLLERGLVAFRERFWNEERGFLYDVVDVDHQGGRVDASLRPNQILAVGGLPLCLLPDPTRARRVVDAVEGALWTPLGLRSLAPGEPGYTPHYEGGPRERDGSYHQGTVWPWLLGPFVDAWVRVRGGGAAVRREAHERFLAPLLAHLDDAGLGHVSEIADADPPHTPRGCPWQAWSTGEALRLAVDLGADDEREPR